ncbi:hypothetical protein PENSPDRAFT_49333 [Peniophora sp. CONT]|nr:hypothetical protein PENSPDRAFT_49333 [Peniophora sp. CONT]
MDASSVSLNEDQARDLIRRSERLELENADLRVRLDRDTATHKRVLAFVESDLLSTRQRRDELAEKLEEATRAQSEAEDNLKVVQTDACDALAQAQREAEERFAEELSVALAQCDSERKLKLEAQSLLQTALEQRKAEEKLRMNAERTLAASQSENDVTRASLEALERRIEDRDARIAHLESCLLAQANERSGPVASEDEAQDALVSMRSALQDKDGELVALMASYDAITLEVSQLRHGRSVDAQALRDLVQARDLKESEKADLALTISNYRRALTESSFELEDKKKELDANVQMLKVERDKVANWTVHLAARSELSSTTTHHDSLPSAATQERAGSRPPLTAGLNVHGARKATPSLLQVRERMGALFDLTIRSQIRRLDFPRRKRSNKWMARPASALLVTNPLP